MQLLHGQGPCRLGFSVPAASGAAASVAFFLLRQAQLTDWRADILGPSLSHFLGSCRTSAVLILHLGLDDVQALLLLSREVFAIFRQILDNFHCQQRLLQRAYYS